MNHRKSAFSLIELSIVILIIGILIAGVTQASRIVKSFRLTTARTLTQSSPIQGLYGLTLWLDTTSEKSFLDSEVSDGSTVSNWFDLNPQRMGSNYTLTSSGTSRPLYKESAINGLPALKFDGSDDRMSRTFLGQDLFGYNESTVFIVQVLDSSQFNLMPYPILACWNCNTNPNRFWIGHEMSSSYTFYAFSNSDDPYVSKKTSYSFPQHYNKTEMLTFTHKSTNYSEYRVNGTTIASSSSDSSTITPTTSATLNISSTGSCCSFAGYFGEVIFFNRALTTEERTSVESYLKQKWGIKT